MARASLLHWLRWYCSLGITYPTEDAAWHSAHFKYSGEGPPALPFIMDCHELGYDAHLCEGGYVLQKVK